MISAIFHAIIYNPLYNGLVFLVGVIPSHDVGLSVIILTLLVRLILYPLSRRASDAQSKMKKLAPEIEELKKKYKKSSPEQSQAIWKFYRDKGIHPLAGAGLLLLQLPILIALYWIFARSGLPTVQPALLYSFVSQPAAINLNFLGFLDMAGHSLVLGALAALAQFVYTRLTMGAREKGTTDSASFSGDLARSFDLQARYVLPATFIILSSFIPSAAMLYLVTSNLFMIGQELFSGKRF